MSLIANLGVPGLPDQAHHDGDEYPLQQRFLLYGVIAGAGCGILLQASAAAVLAASVFWATGLTWRRSDPPILPFCLAYQWLFVAAPYLAWSLDVQTLQVSQRVDPSQAVLLAGLGFIALAAGIRFTWWILRAPMHKASAQLGQQDGSLSVQRLFWVVIAVHVISWVYHIQPMKISYGFSQFIYAMLAVRVALFVLLWQVILQQRRGYRYGLAALAFVLVPMLASKMSGFKGLFFLIFVLVLWELRPGSTIFRTRRGRRLASAAASLVAGLLVLGVIWEGAVKPVWRTAESSGGTLARVQQFMALSTEAVVALDWAVGSGNLLERIGSIDQFARVLTRVPSLLPYEQGSITTSAVKHVFLPRFLFPDKPILDSSRVTRRYAGIQIGAGTSIGIGYMAEFYIDFGAPGMFLAILFYGMVIGLLYTLLLVGSPAAFAAPLLMVMFVDGFDGFESDLAKQLGGLMIRTISFLVLATSLGDPLVRMLRTAPRRRHAGVPPATSLTRRN
ncbi:MAG: hypothetical protein ACRETN_04690 [Nevskiales bacterium]